GVGRRSRTGGSCRLIALHNLGARASADGGMMVEQRGELRVPAIEVRQSPGRLLYSFAGGGKQIPTFATVSGIRRNGTELQGYQRPEVLSHIAEIRTYLESESPMVPNAVVVAFDSRVVFEPQVEGPSASEYARAGTLVIPVDPALRDEDKPGFIVDGQQR